MGDFKVRNVHWLKTDGSIHKPSSHFWVMAISCLPVWLLLRRTEFTRKQKYVVKSKWHKSWSSYCISVLIQEKKVTVLYFAFWSTNKKFGLRKKKKKTDLGNSNSLFLWHRLIFQATRWPAQYQSVISECTWLTSERPLSQQSGEWRQQQQNKYMTKITGNACIWPIYSKQHVWQTHTIQTEKKAGTV